MKILLFGKTRTITGWVEEAAAGFMLGGHSVEVFPYRNSKLKKVLEPWLMSPRLGVPLAGMLARRMRLSKPDMVVAFGPFHWLPPEIFQVLRAVPGRPPLLAWVGDLFGPEAAAAANQFDSIAYTDSGMLGLHRNFGFAASAGFVPLAAQTGAPVPPGEDRQRVPRLAFVASASPQRRVLLSRVREPAALFGTDWRDSAGLSQHTVDARRIGPEELTGIYRRYAGVLNISHEQNVINGLNQRHFAPYIQGTPVVADDQADLETCFDIGSEVLVYRDPGELDALSVELRTHPERIRAVGLAGMRRVFGQHTYAHRLQALASLAGVRFG